MSLNRELRGVISAIVMIMMVSGSAAAAGAAKPVPETAQTPNAAPTVSAAPGAEQTARPEGELGTSRPASETEVASMLSEASRRIVPFTLAEARIGRFTEQGNTGHMQLGDKQWDALTVKRLVGAQTFSVTALVIKQAPAGPLVPGGHQSGNGPLIEVAFFVKEGFASWASGNTGPHVLELREPTAVSTMNAVGFRVVILVDGEISIAFVEDGGHWTVRKYKGAPPNNWPR